MLKVAAFLGSARQRGNNAVLLDQVLKGIKDTRQAEITYFVLNRLSIRACQSCGKCDKTGRCAVRDDMDPIYAALVASDVILLAAPIYFSGLSAQAKTMIDRCQPFWSAKCVLKENLFVGRKRFGSLIATCGQTQDLDQFAGTLQVMKTFNYLLGVKSLGNLLLANIDKQPAATRQQDLEKAYDLGQRLATEFTEEIF